MPERVIFLADAVRRKKKEVFSIVLAKVPLQSVFTNTEEHRLHQTNCHHCCWKNWFIKKTKKTKQDKSTLLPLARRRHHFSTCCSSSSSSRWEGCWAPGTWAARCWRRWAPTAARWSAAWSSGDASGGSWWRTGWRPAPGGGEQRAGQQPQKKKVKKKIDFPSLPHRNRMEAFLHVTLGKFT